MTDKSPPPWPVSYTPGLNLVQLQVIHRHGPRTPLNYRLHQFYPFSWPLCSGGLPGRFAYKGIDLIVTGNETLLLNKPQTQAKQSLEDCLLGQLTDHGKVVMENLGRSLRSNYIDRLQFRPNLDEIYLRSTNFPRTIESLYSLLNGLFPGLHNEKARLTVNVRDEYVEDLYGSTKCAAYKKILEDYAKEFAIETADDTRDLKNVLPHIFKVPNVFGKLPSMYGVWDTLTSSAEHGMPLPNGVDENVMKNIKKIATKEWFDIYTRNEDAIKYSVGRFIREMHSNLFRPDRKLCIYSAHDSTIAPLLGAFEHMTEEGPPFAANIVVELFKEQNINFRNVDEGEKKFVRVIYNKEPLILPTCAQEGNHYKNDPSICTIDAFSSSIMKFIPKNYIDDCRLKE